MKKSSKKSKSCGASTSKISKEQKADDLRRIAETEDMDEIIELSRSEDPLVR